MRQIKFRAWDGKKMHLPEYSDKEDFHIMADGTISFTKEYGYERHEMTMTRESNWVLMQFTGMKDESGLDVYEDDILETRVQDGSKVLLHIVFQNGGFYAKPIREVIYRAPDSWYLCRVVGNAYEHPHLLQPATPELPTPSLNRP